MKQRHLLLVFILSAFTTHWMGVQAQNAQLQRHKIALFAPLYLDSVFDATYNYTYGKDFPKFLHSGLEFYQGAQMALDSLQKTGTPLEVYVYDSRSKTNTIAQQINSPELNDVDLIIAHSTLPELRVLSEAAAKKKVPLISATLPNDGNISNNPYLVILNSTLRTHCEGIYEYLQKNHSKDKIFLFCKSGVQENQLRSCFSEISKTTTTQALKINIVDVETLSDTNALIQKLDSTRKNVCIIGSLDTDFGTELSRQFAAYSKTYPATIIGMPTWEDIKEFTKPEFKNVDIIYTSPFAYTKPGKLQTKLTSDFVAKIGSRPTDMFFRGYETMMRFAQILLSTKSDFASNLTRKGYNVFTQFDIQPVFLNKQNMTLDYFENKKLYFIKIINGVKTVTE